MSSILINDELDVINIFLNAYTKEKNAKAPG